jgi:thiamine biosynthesis lipoprotein
VNDWSNTDSVFSFEDHSFIFSSLWLMSEALHRQTQGAFDPTVLPLVNLWGFGLTERGQVTQEQVDSTLRYVGMSMGVMDLNHKEENLRITETQIRKKYAESKLDFNSIAQGFTVDLILEWLMDQGVNHAMVEIGGEVRCIGLNDRQEAWHIAIDQPIMSDASDRQLEAIIAVKDFAICTSGNYRKFYEEDGIRRSHTIDPQSGFPVDHGMLSATIRAQSAAKADALATACMVMGPSDAERFIEGYQREFPEERLEAVFLIAGEEGKWDTWMTKGWEDSFIPLH